MVHCGLGENDQCTEKGSMKSAVNLSVEMELSMTIKLTVSQGWSPLEC